MNTTRIWRHFDIWLLAAVALLTIAGVAMIQSAIGGNEDLTQLVPRQAIYALIGLVVLFIGQAAIAQDSFDSDNDGFDDNSDNCTLRFNPAQQDTDGDFFGNGCDADFNNDLVINFVDYGLLSDHFFSAEPLTDLDGDGVTNVVDLGLLKTMFLQWPGPTATNPVQPPCTCQFSGDCPSGMFCNYGPGSFTTEDICVWRDVPPLGVPGAGSSIESNRTTGEWIPDLCNGICTAAAGGSPVGLENTDHGAQTIAIWGDAIIMPSAAGGGPVDEMLAVQRRQCLTR